MMTGLGGDCFALWYEGATRALGEGPRASSRGYGVVNIAAGADVQRCVSVPLANARFSAR